MTKNKVFLSIVVFVGVFSLLYGYQDLIGTEEINMVDQVLINGFDFSNVILGWIIEWIVGVGFDL